MADARLVEHTDNDVFWGDGGDGSGHNMLGRLLMEQRPGAMASYGCASPPQPNLHRPRVRFQPFGPREARDRARVLLQ